MLKTKKKTSKALLGFYIAGGVLTVLYIAFFFILPFLAQGVGDSEIEGVGNALNYHIQGIGKLLSFSYGGPKDVLAFSLSALLYAFASCWIVFLVFAGILSERKKRKIIWLAVAIVFLDLIAYAIFASGSEKYFAIIGGQGVFAGQSALLAITICLLVSGLLHFIVSMVCYFWSIVEIHNNPRAPEEAQEETPLEKAEEPLPESSEKEEPLKKAKKKRRTYIVQNFYDE